MPMGKNKSIIGWSLARIVKIERVGLLYEFPAMERFLIKHYMAKIYTFFKINVTFPQINYTVGLLILHITLVAIIINIAIVMLVWYVYLIDICIATYMHG